MGLINTSEIALFNFDDPRLGGGAENTTPLLFISTNFQFFCSLVAVESIASWSEGGSWIDYKHVGRCNPFVNPFGRFNEAKSKRERETLLENQIGKQIGARESLRNQANQYTIVHQHNLPPPTILAFNLIDTSTSLISFRRCPQFKLEGKEILKFPGFKIMDYFPICFSEFANNSIKVIFQCVFFLCCC